VVFKIKPPLNRRYEIKRVTTRLRKHPTIVRIPNIIWIVIIRIQPKVIITLNIENIRIAIRMNKMSSFTTAPQMLERAEFYLGH